MYMRVGCIRILLFLILCSLVPYESLVHAETEGKVKPTTEITVAMLNAYVSNGDELSRHSLVIQPQLKFSYAPWSVVVWGNLDTKPYLEETSTKKGDTRQKWTETDIKLSYERTWGIVRGSATYTYYANAGSGQKDDQDFTLAFGINTYLNPYLSISRSFDSSQRWYILMELSHTFDLSKTVSLRLAASGSYLISQDDERRRINDDGTDTRPDGSKNDHYRNFHDGVVSISLPVKPVDWITVTPQVSYVFPLCHDAKNDMKKRSIQQDTAFADRESSFLVWGVSFTFTF
ncbi:MAG: hypothetical protein N2317_05890 [Syntrophales bacterium]|nr:hypothetical protein [Syntrophales bacterium]